MLQYSYRPNAPATRAARGNAFDWADYSAIVDRPPLRWPNNARVALWICPNILHFEYMPPADPWVDSWARMAAPDVLAYGRQDYGVRVGFWRMLDVLDKHKARCTAVVNSSALERFPGICSATVERGWDYVGHGQYNTRFIFGHDRAAELAYHTELRARVEALTGVRMVGTGGPGPQAATEDTPDILAEAGFTYYTDWFFDDQPFPLKVKSGRLIALPYTLEINDPPFLGSAFEADQFADALKRQFDVLYAEGATSGRVMCISLHGYLFGQPQRACYLDEALRYVLSFPDVWQATGAEIAQYYMSNYYDKTAAHLAARAGAES
jgi:peptidoglycan/xylan/chitin deacetylase (PgdA/CDA1 family)